MIIIALVLCIIISTGSFVWGYCLAGYDEASRWIIAFGVFWLASHWRKWKWFFAPAVFMTLLLAAYGVWFEFQPAWMLSGAAFAVFAWNLTEFQRKLGMLPAREDKAGMTRRHLLRIGLLALGTILIAMWLGLGR